MLVLHLGIAVLPAAVMALLATTAVLLLLADGPEPSTNTMALLLGAAATAVLLVAVAAVAAGRATRQVHDRIDDLRSTSARGRTSLHELVGRLKSGERPDASPAPAVVAPDSDPFTFLAYERAWEQYAAESAILEIAGRRTEHSSEQQVEVFVNVARRMQSLVHREITLLDDLEAQVEDPDLLKGLFTIDHLATRMRRQSESLAVLGGSTSRRQWTRPVSLYEVLRSAVAEVEHYSRVKVVPPVSGTLNGNTVVDVIHLIAELIENATKFSPPHTQVMVRADEVAAGLAVDIDDRGLGMPREDMNRMNDLLADPGQIDVAELLRDGRIGLFVVSSLARKHGVKVQLRNNLYGGVQTVVLVPHELLSPRARGREATPRTGAAPAEPGPAPAAPAEPGPTPAAPSPVPRPEAAPVRVDVPGAERPKLSTRQPGAQDGDRRQAPSSPPAAPQGQAPRGERPPLPERQAQTHLAPELRRAPAPDRRAQEVDHTPGLMAAYQSGFHRAEEQYESDPSAHESSTD
ncbi:sensor histidine kinase [Nocardiopsis xinjiangensis]|uniref:sensor histidine kinase n=1 Tax=Nocardiopsis xinjiangensis TaxID=124285 RepID=UPI00034D8AC3|nr:ATP-binding protein [Nocardiopsis xinjiangensis]